MIQRLIAYRAARSKEFSRVHKAGEGGEVVGGGLDAQVRSPPCALDSSKAMRARFPRFFEISLVFLVLDKFQATSQQKRHHVAFLLRTNTAINR